MGKRAYLAKNAMREGSYGSKLNVVGTSHPDSAKMDEKGSVQGYEISKAQNGARSLLHSPALSIGITVI